MSSNYTLNDYLNDYPVLNLKEVSYNVFRIKNRIIYEPCRKLKQAQRYIKKWVNMHYPLELSTHNSAKQHTGKKWVLKMDIKDFYGSVRYEYIQRIIQQTFYIYATEEIVNYLTDIVTVGKHLPVGAPTSAHIANACFLPLDKKIKEYSNRHDVEYSRYMDDMTFSCNNKNILNSVEHYVSELIQQFGFKLNEKKTRYISSNKQQNILGIVVNKEVRTPKELRKKVRAMIHHYAISKGQYAPKDTDYTNFDQYDEIKLRGYINYIKSVDKKTYEQLEKYCQKFRTKLF